MAIDRLYKTVRRDRTRQIGRPTKKETFRRGEEGFFSKLSPADGVRSQRRGDTVATVTHRSGGLCLEPRAATDLKKHQLVKNYFFDDFLVVFFVVFLVVFLAAFFAIVLSPPFLLTNCKSLVSASQRFFVPRQLEIATCGVARRVGMTWMVEAIGHEAGAFCSSAE
ncbi:MAG TPA: hypothetical protein VF624_13870 [Tepidisphaeraceae bacterium]